MKRRIEHNHDGVTIHGVLTDEHESDAHPVLLIDGDPTPYGPLDIIKVADKYYTVGQILERQFPRLC